VTIKNKERLNIFEYTKNVEFKVFLESCVSRCKQIEPLVTEGNKEKIEQVYEEHFNGAFPLCSLRCR
jgi:hypothetical protein